MIVSSKKYFEFTVRDASISNVENLLFGESSFFQEFEGKTKEEQANTFLNYKDETGNSNLDKIKETWSLEQETNFLTNPLGALQYPINQGTTVLIPFSVVSRDIISIFGDAIQSTDAPGFISDALKRLYNDPKNVRTAASKVTSLGNAKDIFNHISVWVWSKALNSDVSGAPGSEEIKYSKNLINITPFILDCNTSVTKDGGSFSLSLDPVIGKIGDNNKWEIDWSYLKTTLKGEYVAQIPIKDRDNMKSSFFFNNVLFANDLVFIRFETLESEEDRFYGNGKNPDLNVPHNFMFSSDDVQGKIFDMIGLIDVTSLSENAGNSDISIQVHGRDMCKLLIEDGVYFYPFDFLPNGGIFANITEDERLDRFDGRLLGRFQVQFKHIDNILNFIINALGNIRICSDNLFESYQNYVVTGDENPPVKNRSGNEIPAGQVYDARTHKVKLFPDQTGEMVPLHGIWQIIKLVVDSTVQQRLVADSSIGNEQGSIINAIRKICQEPFCEFYGDTIGDQYYFTVRKPPFDFAGMNSMIAQLSENTTGRAIAMEECVVNVYPDDISDMSLEYTTDEAYSWFHLNPMGNMQGGDSFAYLRAVYFKEYADIWGSKPFDIVSNYIPVFPILSGQDMFLGISYMIKQAIMDLQYLIQSHAYLPFSRRGTITIQGGNRRIKRGTFVRLVNSGEIGYVDSVSHHSSISMNQVDRTTTIQISRVLKEEYIKGSTIEGIGKVSYFNIIDMPLPSTSEPQRTEFVTNNKDSWDQWNSEGIGKWKVNPKVFNFFLQQRHLE